MRPDKATLAAVAATLALYQAGRATARHPRLADDRGVHELLRERASAGRGTGPRAGASAVELRSTVGGGSLPARPCIVGASPSQSGPPTAWSLPCGAASRVVLARIEADGSSSTCDRSGRGLAGVLPGAIAPAIDGRPAMTVVVGTAGHIDHGKTTLLRALTGIDADRLPEERRRGMPIDVGYATSRLPDGTELDFVDVPGTTGWSATCWWGGRDRRRAPGRGGGRRSSGADAGAPRAADASRSATRWWL
jgi:hypothetical protein